MIISSPLRIFSPLHADDDPQEQTDAKTDPNDALGLSKMLGPDDAVDEAEVRPTSQSIQRIQLSGKI